MPGDFRVGPRHRRPVVATIQALGLALALAPGLAPAIAEAAPARPIDLPAQPLATSLLALSRQTGTIIIAPAALVRDGRRRPCAVAWSRPTPCDACCAARTSKCPSAPTG